MTIASISTRTIHAEGCPFPLPRGRSTSAPEKSNDSRDDVEGEFDTPEDDSLLPCVSSQEFCQKSVIMLEYRAPPIAFGYSE
jgi:hypothetical protein